MRERERDGLYPCKGESSAKRRRPAERSSITVHSSRHLHVAAVYIIVNPTLELYHHGLEKCCEGSASLADLCRRRRPHEYVQS